MKLERTLNAPNRTAWRTWLEQHHASAQDVWLIYYKAHTHQPCISYEESVEEALCFGWVDSLIQKIDEDRYARLFTPRRKNSNWSEVNKRRMAKVIAEGRMTPAGREKMEYPPAKASAPPPKSIGDIPDWLQTAIQSSPLAWENFSKLPPSHQRRYLGWITSAKKEDTRQKRAQEAVDLLRQNKRLGIGPGEVRK